MGINVDTLDDERPLRLTSATVAVVVVSTSVGASFNFSASSSFLTIGCFIKDE